MNFSRGRYIVPGMAANKAEQHRAEVRSWHGMWASLPRPLLGLAAALVLGCALFRSAVNDSPAIRWWLFSHYGADRMCPEMQRRTAPLRLTPGGSVIGRLFPTSCQSQIDDGRRTWSVSSAARRPIRRHTDHLWSLSCGGWPTPDSS